MNESGEGASTNYFTLMASCVFNLTWNKITEWGYLLNSWMVISIGFGFGLEVALEKIWESLVISSIR